MSTLGIFFYEIENEKPVYITRQDGLLVKIWYPQRDYLDMNATFHHLCDFDRVT